MEKAPERRFADGEEMRAALRNWRRIHMGMDEADGLHSDTQSMEIGIERPARTPPWFWGLGLLTLMVVAGVWWTERGGTEPESEANGPVVEPAPELAAEPVPEDMSLATVRVALESEPTGAEVWFGGEVIGRTPLEQDLTIRIGLGTVWREFSLKKEGYQTKVLRLDLSRGSASGSVSLRPKESPEPSPMTKRTDPKPGRAKKNGASSPVRTAATPVEVSKSVQESSISVYVVDGVEFTEAQAMRALERANSLDLAGLKALGIRAQQANVVLEKRPYSSIGGLGATPGIGPVTLRNLRGDEK